MAGPLIGRRALLAGGLAPGDDCRCGARGTPPPYVRAPAGTFVGDNPGRSRPLPRHSLRHRAALPRAGPGGAAAGALVPAQSFGPVSPQQGTRYAPQSEDCLYLNIWTPATDARAREAGDGLHPWRRLFERKLDRSAQRRPEAGCAGRRRGGDREPPAQRLRLSLSRPARSALPRQRQCRPARPDPRLALGARQYRFVRRRPEPGHGLRPVRRRRQDRDPDGHARRARPVPPRARR